MTPHDDDAPADAPVALFGGTFDPVHQAHIECARAVSRTLGGCPVYMLPNAAPPHRPPPGATAGHRQAMLDIACRRFPELRIDRRELDRPGPSHTRDTLAELRRENGQRPLVFILGSDSLASLDCWYHWEEFPGLCHLAVVPRPGAAQAPAQVLAAFPEAGADTLRQTPAGCRLMLEAPLLDCSATRTRDELAEKRYSPAVPAAVLDYIHQHRLYNRADEH